MDCAVNRKVKHQMRVSLTPLYRGVVLILVLTVIPAYETMFNSYRPTWTSIRRDGAELRTGTFIQMKPIAAYRDIVFGVNVRSHDVRFKDRWHRLRLGFPLKPITIDYEERKGQVQGRIETNWLSVNIGLSLVLWMLFELIRFAARRSQRD